MCLGSTFGLVTLPMVQRPSPKKQLEKFGILSREAIHHDTQKEHYTNIFSECARERDSFMLQFIFKLHDRLLKAQHKCKQALFLFAIRPTCRFYLRWHEQC